ncbi:40S ribosomal protein S27-like protein [Carex littledalei]|uniref:40S ribosomal protein S27-like protein n=1 Tax=Carex littledalei TaxID=544730 RepID=A0A833R0T1_9POAL|nr:40S ribosomal protein S27-like protein [Carex littledalei]
MRGCDGVVWCREMRGLAARAIVANSLCPDGGVRGQEGRGGGAVAERRDMNMDNLSQLVSQLAPFKVLQNDIDLLNPPTELEKLKHKKKRLVQSPNSFFMSIGGHLTFGQSGEAEAVSARGEEVEAKDSSVVWEKLNCSFNA